MTYNNALKHINSLPEVIKGSSEILKQICSALGSPQKKLKTIKICGDAGKTSCAHMLMSVLSKSGYRVGYYCPSHSDDLRECIKIGEKDIQHTEFSQIAKRVFDALSATGTEDSISKDEITFIIALFYFAYSECDVVIIERKMSDDQTHFVNAPILSLITSVYNGISATASEALVPRGTKETVSCIQHKNVYDDISRICADVGCRLSLPLYSDLEVKKITLFNTHFTYRGNEYSLGTFSPCQLLNAITVIEAAHALARIGMNISDADISSGLSAARLPLMCQALAIEPTVIIATVTDERHLEALIASLAQVSGLLHNKIDVFTSPKTSVMTADLPTRLSSCALACETVVALDPSDKHSFNININDIIAPMLKSDNQDYAAIFIGDDEYVSELSEQIKKILSNIV